MPPMLDVTDVLSDPDFQTTLTLTRTASASAKGGFAQFTSGIPATFSAVVQPASSNDLMRMPTVENLSGTIVIFTTTRLVVQAPGITADVVTWQGRDYTVMHADDWTEFGAGYVRALASMLSLR